MLQVFDTNGILIFDAAYVAGGAAHDVYSFSAGQNTLTFSDFAGKTMLLNIIMGDTTEFSIDYNLGYPRLVINSYSPTYFFITFK